VIKMKKEQIEKWTEDVRAALIGILMAPDFCMGYLLGILGY